MLLGLDLGLGCVNCCPASPKLLLGLDLRLGCDNLNFQPFFQRKDNEHKFLRPKTITTSWTHRKRWLTQNSTYFGETSSRRWNTWAQCMLINLFSPNIEISYYNYFKGSLILLRFLVTLKSQSWKIRKCENSQCTNILPQILLKVKILLPPPPHPGIVEEYIPQPLLLYMFLIDHPFKRKYSLVIF